MNEIKKYIFLTTAIRNVGGAQLYISAKINWLLSIGWDAEVFYFDKGEISIKNLARYDSNYTEELSIPFLASTKIVKKAVFKKIKLICKKCNCIIVESHTPELSLWGEYIANKVKAKHVSYFLSETFSKHIKRYSPFIKYKFDQNLLFGITDNSLSDFFGDNFFGRRLIASGCSTNIVEDIIDDTVSQISKADFNILSLGRLEKSYISNMVKSIIKFADNNLEKSINVFLVGDSSDISTTNTVIYQLSGRDNIKCVFFGYKYPIPRIIFILSDVCIASAGSVRVASSEGVPTISIDTNDHESIGVFNYTTKNTLYRDGEELTTTVQLLNDILLNNKYPRKQRISKEYNIDFTQHLKIIKDPFEYNYYKLSTLGISLKYFIIRIILFFNKKAYFKLRRFKSKINKYILRN